MGYCGVLWGTVGYYGGTVGYCGYCRVLEVLWDTGGMGVLGSDRGKWWKLWGTMGYCVVLWGHCMVLLVTAGYFWVLGGTGVH